MNCGVKLGDGEERCPLCGLRAYHPDMKRELGKPAYPREWIAPEAERSAWRFLLTVFFAVAIVSCLLVDWLLVGQVTWSGYVIASLLTTYIILVLPLWLSRQNPVVLLPLDFLAVGLMLLYMNWVSGGSWFMTLAFPVTGMYGILATAVAALVRYVRKGRFFQIGGVCIAYGCSFMLLEFFLCLTYGTRMFRWSLYPLAVLTFAGLFWILAGIIRPLGDAIRKRVFW